MSVHRFIGEIQETKVLYIRVLGQAMAREVIVHPPNLRKTCSKLDNRSAALWCT